MAGKKNSRTSKTDHVLSLLAGAGADREGASPAPAEQEKTEAPQKTETTSPAQPAPPERHLAPPILEVARLHNEALSETIRAALTESLEQEMDQTGQEAAPQMPAQADSPEEALTVPEEVPAEREVPAAEEPSALEDFLVPEESPVTEEAPAPEEVPSAEAEKRMEEDSPAPEEPPVAAAPPAAEVHLTEKELPTPNASPAPMSGPGKVLPDGSVFLNVMELVVEKPLEKYVKLFGLCDCPRCLADVRALALSRLQAKYVVLPASTVTPMLSLYQAKFDSMVIAQVIQACKTVMESPRHTL